MGTHSETVNAYLRNKIINATSMQLVIMLYDGAITSLGEAKKSFDQGNSDITCLHLIHAREMISELRNSLDLSVGEVGRGLHRLYSYMLDQLIPVNVEKKPESVDELIMMLTELRGTWFEAMKKAPHREQHSTTRTPPL